MLVDAKRLRWLGMDLCSRDRRRVAVVATYAAFVLAMWVHPARQYQVEQVLFWGGVTSRIWPAIEEATSKWMRRAIAALALLVGAWEIWEPSLHMHQDPTFLTFALLTLYSALGWGRLVDMGYAGWMARAIRKGTRLSWRGQQRLARRGFLYGLEGFAWQEYGLRFKELTDQQKAAVEEMRRRYPQGKWMAGMEQKLVDDERMRAEDNRVRAQAQRLITFVIGCSALTWGWAVASEWKIGGEVVAAWAWTLFGLAITLREAIVLWAEEDPRGVQEELEVVQGQEV